MESEVLKIALTQGIWATLAIFLILYILKYQEKRDAKQDEREEKYQLTIMQLSEKLNLVVDIKEEILDIKNLFLKM